MRLLAPLGHGGMSDVWLGALRGPAGFEKLVAVKQLRFVPNDRYDGGAAFLREARLAALLNHPNIVHTFEVVAQGGDYRIVMEFLEGQPLNRILKRAGASVPLREWIRVTSDLLAGLHYAHELTDLDGRPLGVVHRDVSPHNVFVDWE
ncbi:MAG: protein kinase, partial [Myxococcota bacterium]